MRAAPSYSFANPPAIPAFQSDRRDNRRASVARRLRSHGNIVAAIPDRTVAPGLALWLVLTLRFHGFDRFPGSPAATDHCRFRAGREPREVTLHGEF